MDSPAAGQQASRESDLEMLDSQADSEPGVGQLVSSIQHIIKDSAGSPQNRPLGSGHSSPPESASLVASSPSGQSHAAAQQGFGKAQEERRFSLEDGMSEISISDSAPNVAHGSNAPTYSPKPRLSAPRRSLQPPTSPFAEHDDSPEDGAPVANGRLEHHKTRAQAPGSSSQGDQAAAPSLVGGEDKDLATLGVAAQARPFSPPPGTAAPVQAFFPQEPPAEFYEPPEFKGLLFYDGVDSLGRPVVVVDFDVVAPSTARSAVMQYILQRLEPIVSQGPYVLVLLSTGRAGTSRLKGAWLIAAYKGLSRPFRKNVKYILLVKPSNGIRALLLLFRPFVSRKAHNKLKRVHALGEIASATNNEVQLQHLGPRFASSAGQFIADDIKAHPASGQNAARSFDMPSSGPT